MSTKGAKWCALCSAVLFALLATAVAGGQVQNTDLAIRAALHQWVSPPLTAFMKFCTRWGAPRVDAAVLLAASATLVAKRNFETALWLVFALAGAGVLRYTLAMAFHRARPLPFFAPEPMSYSFPSGHAVYSTCVYGVLVSVLTRGVQSRLARTTLWIVAFLWLLAIGFSRVYLGFHYATDVLGGYVIALTWISVLVLVREQLVLRPRHSTQRSMPTRS